jgi:hypothetical protein
MQIQGYRRNHTGLKWSTIRKSPNSLYSIVSLREAPSKYYYELAGKTCSGKEVGDIFPYPYMRVHGLVGDRESNAILNIKILGERGHMLMRGISYVVRE